MGRLSASLLVLALAAAAALGLTACGGGGADLLPGDTAGEINSNLDQVEQLAGEGDCIGAADAAQAVSAQIEALNGVDRKLKLALQEGATRLNEVVAQCEEAPEEEVEAPLESEIEPEEEAEEEREKPAKKKQKQEAEAPESETTAPPQGEGESKGKGKGHETGEEETPPVEPETGGEPSGGVGPATPAGGE